jgi:YHS domain-containing protein
MNKAIWFVLVAIGLAGLLAVVGCGSSKPPAAPQAANALQGQNPHAAGTAEGEHAHKPGAHGGTIVAIGRDSYHAEAVFEKGGIVRLYTLGQDEAKVLEVEAQTLNGFVKREGDSESTSIIIKPEPQQGDGAGKTSQLVAKLPRELWSEQVVITIPSITIGGERFRIAFGNAAAAGADHGDHGMPKQAADEAEKKLYLTAGGIYTDADIKANGNLTASQKFAGTKAQHDLTPKAGDKICPITLTKANPQFSWVIGGKTYEFCCPPCVDEFVAQAKDPQTAGEIKDPSKYVKK